MSEETNQSNESAKVSEVKNSAMTSGQSITLKDLITPISIVIAGIFIGGGLYFGGGSVDSAQPSLIADGSGQEVEDKTSLVNPVTGDDHIKGDLDAQVKIVEFSDFDCPFCSRFHDAMNNVVAKYPANEVAWVYRQFPLEQLHPQAPAVAVASECVAEIGGNDAFWKFSDAYFGARGSNDSTPHSELIPKLVTSAGVDQTAFTECFESGELLSEVQADMDNAVETGGRGTPWSIIIGPTGKTYPINGALPQSAIEQLIEVAKEEA